MYLGEYVLVRQAKACSQGRITTPLPWVICLKTLHGLANEVLRSIAGMGVAIHAEEVRGIDHGRKHVAVLGHPHDVLPGVRQVDRTLPRHHAEDIQGEQRTRGVQFGVSMFQEVRDDIRPMPVGVIRLEHKAGVLLVAFSGEAHIVELHFVRARLRLLSWPARYRSPAP